ncbi:MAG: PadR family transcriptional regulator [Bacillales bacterium]|jgi:DNA-binding PadR family transcriptional regulator|nr:PadR family transcriptional regulator [Bacillales bacterium]
MSKSQLDEVIHSFLVEMKRGTMTIIVLTQLQTKQYGYSLLTVLEKKKTGIEAGTLYPLLRRLEKQGLLQSEWDTSESRPRKFYQLSDLGKEVLERIKKEWDLLSNQMDHFLGEVL